MTSLDRNREREQKREQRMLAIAKFRAQVRFKPLPKLRTYEQAVQLARRLGDDVSKIKRNRGRLKKVFEEANIALANRKRYSLLEGEEPSGERPLKLAPYVWLADAIAAELGLHPDDYLFEVLQPFGLMDPRPAADEVSALVNLLIGMSRAVASAEALDVLLEQAARTRGTLDLLSGGIRMTSMILLRDRWHIGGEDHWTEPQFIPSVPLCKLGEWTVPGTVRLGPNLPVPPDASDNTAQLAAEQVTAPRRAAPCDVEISLWREFRLAIAEPYQACSIGPMIEGRGSILIRYGGDWVEPALPWGLDGFGSDSPRPVALHFPSGWRVGWVHISAEDRSAPWKEPVPEVGDGGLEHHYLSYHPLDAWTLGRLVAPRAADQYEPCWTYPDVDPAFEPRFADGVGRSIEFALYTGDLEAALRSEIQRLRSQLEERRLDRTQRIDAQDVEMTKRWQELGLQADAEFKDGGSNGQ